MQVTIVLLLQVCDIKDSVVILGLEISLNTQLLSSRGQVVALGIRGILVITNIKHKLLNQHELYSVEIFIIAANMLPFIENLVF